MTNIGKLQTVKGVYKSQQLVEMTRDLTDMLRKNRIINWQKKESARAGIRRMIKRLLKKYKYPPEGQADTLQTIMSQYEFWADQLYKDFSAKAIGGKKATAGFLLIE